MTHSFLHYDDVSWAPWRHKSPTTCVFNSFSMVRKRATQRLKIKNTQQQLSISYTSYIGYICGYHICRTIIYSIGTLLQYMMHVHKTLQPHTNIKAINAHYLVAIFTTVCSLHQSPTEPLSIHVPLPNTFWSTWWRHQMGKKFPRYWPFARRIHRSLWHHLMNNSKFTSAENDPSENELLQTINMHYYFATRHILIICMLINACML